MGLSRRKQIVIGADEAAFGVDALSGLTTTQLSEASMLAINPQPSESATLIERPAATGTKGSRPTGVGRGQNGLSFAMEMTGSADPTNTPPSWLGNAKSAGMQSAAALRIPSAHQGSSPTLQRFMQGELVYGPTVCEGSWEDAEWGSGGSGASDPNPSPSSPMSCVLYPDGSTVNDADAVTGQLYDVISAVEDYCLIRLDDGVDTMPKAGWHLRVDTTGSGAYVYTQLTAPTTPANSDDNGDMPVALCVYPDLQSGSANTNLYCYKYQGHFPQVPGSLNALVGQKSGAYGNIVTLPASAGTLLRPDSEQTIEVQVDGSSWTAPSVNDEIVRRDDPSNVEGGARVIAVATDSPSSGTDTLTLQDYWGTFLSNGGNGKVYVPSSTEEADITADAVQVRTPSRSFYTVIDGRRFSLVGARTQMTISATSGEAGQIQFDAQGTQGSAPAMITMPSLDAGTDIPPRWQSGVAVFDGHKLRTESMSLALNNTLAEVPDANSPDGVAGVSLTARDPQLDFVVETAGALAKQGDWEAALRSGDWRVAGFAFINSAGTRRVAVTCPRLQIESATPQGEDTLQHAVSAKCREIQGDDELFILVF